MSIEVGCEACGARFAAPERWAGKSGKCPQCGGAIVVPQPDANANEKLVPVQPDANADEALVPVEQPAEQAGEQPAAQTVEQPVAQPLAGLLDEELGDGDPLGPPAAGGQLLGRGKKAKRKRTTHRSPRKRTDSVWGRNGIMMLVVGGVVLLLVLLYVSLGMYRSAGFFAFWGIGVILMAIPKRNEEIEWIIAKLVGGLLGGAWILFLFWTIGRVWLIIWETGEIPLGFYGFLLDAMFTTVIVLTIIGIIFWLSGRFGFFRIWSWKYVIMLGILPAITFTLAMLPEDGYVPGTRFFRPRSTLASAPSTPPPATPPRRPLPVAPPRPKTRPAAPVPKPDPAPPRFDMAPHRVPFFADLPTMQVLEPGVLAAEVKLGVADGLPGQADKLHVYFPAGAHRTKSLACVLVAPAGSNLLSGGPLGDGDRAEHLPYVRAGMAVVAYELDGPLDDGSPEALRRAYTAFRAAGAGMINARNAIDFVIAKLPQVDPQRLYAAGHSSAGTTALLLAAHDSRIRGCVAYAAAPGVGQLQAQAVSELEPPLPDLDEFIRRSSPIEQASRIRCPVLLFHSEADDVVSREETMQLYQALSRAGGRVSMHKVRQGDHYASMIDEGIPYAINWLVKSAGAGSSGAVANLPEAVQAPSVVPDAVPWNVPLDPIRAGTVTLGTQPIPLRSSRTEFVRAVFSQPETAKAVTLSRAAGSGSARSGDAPFWLDAYDLAASRHAERIGLSSQCQLHAVSAGGTLVLLTIGTQAQVWSLSDRKVVASWKYAFDTKGEAVWARFGDDGHVAILGRNGDLAFWEVAACRKLFSLGRVDCATVTAGGRYVVALISRSAMLGGHVCDARSGELCGSLKPSSLASWQAEACAMKPDGTLLAAVGRNRVAAWDMRTGQRVGEADQAPSGRTLGFVGNQLLHVDEQIFQPNTGNVVWRYQIDGMTSAADWAKLDGTPDGRPWITVSRSALDPVYLVPLETADAAARAAILAAGQPVPRGSTKITADVILPRAGTGTVPVAPVPHVAATDQGASTSDDAQEYVRKTYVDLIAGDPAGVVERLRWHPRELRPGVGLRWGVAVQWIGEDAGAPVRSELQFAEVTGNVGPGIVAGLSQRMQQGKFGDWPSASGTRRDHVVFLGSDPLAALLDAARREALDRIVVINLSPKMIGLQRRRDVLMTIRLIDVASGQSQWASPQLRASQMIAAVQAGGNPAAAMAGEVMKEVDARHVLEPMPAMQPEHVAARVSALVKELSDRPAEMLPVLVELRYYQAKGLLDTDTATEMYDRVVGIGQGSLLAGDDEAKRRAVLKAWIESK